VREKAPTAGTSISDDDDDDDDDDDEDRSANTIMINNDDAIGMMTAEAAGTWHAAIICLDVIYRCSSAVGG
jgi:hypothetical protein